jgi:hypothetical protein
MGIFQKNDNDIFGSWSVIIITPKDNGTYFSGIISYFTTVPEMGIMEVSLTRRLKECPTPKEAVEHTIKNSTACSIRHLKGHSHKKGSRNSTSAACTSHGNTSSFMVQHKGPSIASAHKGTCGEGHSQGTTERNISTAPAMGRITIVRHRAASAEFH